MKKLISLALVLLLLGSTLVGCMGGTDYSAEKTQINALLNNLAAAMQAKNQTNVLNCFANTITVIDTDGTATPCDQIAYSVIIQVLFAIPYTTFDYNNRNVNVTSATNATVTCVQTYSIGLPVPAMTNKKFTLVKSGGAWEITVDRTNP